MTDIPNSILQMAYNKLYIPLSMLTTPALSKIHMNDNLKFCKIPFGNGIGKQSLDEASFPSENTLTVTTFLQAYRNWFSIINIIMTPEMVVGWYEHHSRMLRDEKFVGFNFEAWHDMDKKLHTQFITRPFPIDPDSPTYIQLLERSHMDSFLACAKKAQHTFKLQHVACTNLPRPAQQENGSPTSQRRTLRLLS